MDMAQHLRIIWRRRVPIVLVSLLLALLVYGWSSSKADVYQADVQVSVDPAISENNANYQAASLFVTRTIATSGTTRPVLEIAVKEAGLDITADQARGRVSVNASTSVPQITITATGPSVTSAATLAKSTATALSANVASNEATKLADALAETDAQIDVLQQQLDSMSNNDPERDSVSGRLQNLFNQRSTRELADHPSATVLGSAVAQTKPISPKPERDAIFALLALLVINSELAVGLSALGDRFSSEADVTHLLDQLGIPVLARVPNTRVRPDLLDAFRDLRTSLLMHHASADHLRIAVTSSEPRVGKSFVSTHTAQSLADLGLETVLIDADLRSPAVHTALHLERSPGLTEVLLDGAEPGIDQAGQGNLHVITAGRAVDDAVGLLAGPDFEVLVDKLAATSSVIIDTPPAGLFADAGAVARACDGFILVVRAGTGRRSDLAETLHRLDQVGAIPLGAVLNRTNSRAARYRYGHPRGLKGLLSRVRG